jgi:hypothetical protein
MKKQTFVFFSFLSVFSIFSVISASADTIFQWTFTNAQFGNGASLTGSFDVDYTGITRLISWDVIIGQGPLRSGTNYSQEWQTFYSPVMEFTPSNCTQLNFGLKFQQSCSISGAGDWLMFSSAWPNAPTSDPSSWTVSIPWGSTYDVYLNQGISINGAYFSSGGYEEDISSGTMVATAGPEPTSLVLLGLGGLLFGRRAR